MRTCNEIIEGIGPAKPTARCRVSDWRGLNEEETDERGDGTGINWLGDPLDAELVEELYPTRELFQSEGLSNKERKEAVAAYTRQLAQSGGDPADMSALQAVAHFRGAEFDEDDDGQPRFQVYVGDYVELQLEDRPKGVAQVVELYQDPVGTRRLRLHWFYSIHDDEVKLLLSGKDRNSAKDLAGYDPHRLWRARERDAGAYQVEFELKNIERKVEVKRVELGQAPPTDGSYWWDSEIGAICYTIERPLDREAPSKQKFADRPRLLRVMDLYAGGGGFGYMDTRSQLGSGRDRVEVRTDWAMDYETDMAATFKANFQHTHVFSSGADEWLSLCKEVKRLCDKYGVGAESEDPANKQAFAWEQLGRRDDDRLVEPPRSLVLERRGRKGKKTKENSAGRANAAAGAADEDAKGKGKGKKRAAEEPPFAEDDSNVIVIESSEEVVILEPEEPPAASEDEEKEEEDENAPGPSSKRAKRSSTGARAPAAAKPATKKGGKQSAVKEGAAGDEEKPLSPRTKRRQHFDVAGEEARGIDWPADSHTPAANEVAEVLAVRLCEKAPRQPNSGVTANQLVREIQDSECRLEFKVRWSSGEEPSWQPESALGACRKQLTAFCKQLRRNQAIPFPGEVDLICGGPPCQGVSGNNRHAAMTDILKDVRNRQLTVFLATVDWFQPAFVLMENVQDILKKEEGAYIKYALSHLLQNGHQVRLALLAAGDYGQCQGRWRCFLWGARSGEQLPAYPEATHNCRNFHTAVGHLGKVCQGGFISAESAEHAYPAVLMGDILADLPAVGNGELRERLPYDKDPVYAQQCWLRRRPHAWQTSVSDRLAFRESYMGPEAKQLNKKLVQMGAAEGFVALGLKSLNTKNPLTGAKDTKGRAKQRKDGRQEGNHVFETLDAVYHKLAAKDKGVAQVLRLQWEGSRLSYAHERGKEFHQELQQALAADGQEDLDAVLTDQRPLALNDDDHLRITRVPPRESYAQFVNFRSMEGLVTHPDGQCCYGHQHAYILSGTSVCPGGGSYAKPTKEQKRKAVREGNHHKMRVDESDKNGPRMVSLPGCPAFTKFLPTMDPEVPRWCVTFKEGRSNGRHGGYGRVHYAGVVSTVLGRAEPHNLELAHPRQHRVLTIRENARAQGFPDYHVFCAKVGTKTGRWVRNQTLVQRYQMIGNAVCPAVAAALGRCLALAAVGESPPGQEFISVPDEEYDEVIAQAREEGLSFFYEDYCAQHEKGFKAVPLEARLCAMAATGQGAATAAAAADTEGNGSGAEEEEEEEDDFESANSDGEDE